MLEALKLFFRTLIIVIISLIGTYFIGRFLFRIIPRAPGVFVALSLIAIGVFAFALYKGSFSAVGLHTKRSIKIAITVSVILFIISTAILIVGFVID